MSTFLGLGVWIKVVGYVPCMFQRMFGCFYSQTWSLWIFDEFSLGGFRSAIHTQSARLGQASGDNVETRDPLVPNRHLILLLLILLFLLLLLYFLI